MNHRKKSYLPETQSSGVSQYVGATTSSFRKIRRSRLLVVFVLAGMALGMLTPSYGQGTTVINCPSGFASNGSCGVSFISASEPFAVQGTTNGSTPAMSGPSVNLAPTGSQHTGLSLIYQTLVNTAAFSTTFTFQPNGQNISFVVNDSNNSPDFMGSAFAAGAGCEGSFYQAFGGYPVSGYFALMLDSQGSIGSGSSTFGYSNAQVYQQSETPCNPNDSQSPYASPQNKVSTSPVPLNSPASTANTCVQTVGGTCDTYSATIIYTGQVVTLNLYDVTAGGTCSPVTSGSCFSYSWQVGNVPSMIGGVSNGTPVNCTGGGGKCGTGSGTYGWVGFEEGIGSINSSYPLLVHTWTYSELTAAATPAFSSGTGTYGSTQSVTISDATSGSYICYNFTGAPMTNGIGGCENGTLYSGAISVPSGRTIYAVAGVPRTYADSTIATAAYNIAGTGSMPTFNQPGGTWQGTQTVQLTAAQGGVICYNTTGSPATNGSTGCSSGTLYSTPLTVSSNETLYAVAGGTGFTDSSVASAAYVLNPFAGTVPASAPTFSPLPGTYSGSQNVTISCATPSSNICYSLASSSSPPLLTPQTNNGACPYGNTGCVQGCTEGTEYTGAVTISSTQTLYAMCGTPWTSAAKPPSSLVQGTYTINSSTSGQTPAAPTITHAGAVLQ